VGVLELDDPGEPHTLQMAPGDVLALLSDGIYEYVNDQGAQFGEERVAELLGYHHELPTAMLSKELLQAVVEFGEGAKQADDVTIVLIRRLMEQ